MDLCLFKNKLMQMKQYGALLSVMYPTLDVKLASMLTYITYSMSGYSAPLFHLIYTV